jgi:hypothetical protein
MKALLVLLAALAVALVLGPWEAPAQTLAAQAMYGPPPDLQLVRARGQSILYATGPGPAPSQCCCLWGAAPTRKTLQVTAPAQVANVAAVWSAGRLLSAVYLSLPVRRTVVYTGVEILAPIGDVAVGERKAVAVVQVTK